MIRALLPLTLALAACGPSPATLTPPPPPAAPLPQPLRDFAKALSLRSDQLCARIGLAACSGQRPLDPDRAAVAACMARRDLDRGDTPEIWRGTPLRDPGHLADVDHPRVRAAVDAFYQRTQLAPADHRQWAQLRKMYVQLDAEREAPWPDWAVLVCFAALQQLKRW